MIQSKTPADASFERAWMDAYSAYLLGENVALLALLSPDVVLTVDADELLLGAAGQWEGKDGFRIHLAAAYRDFDIANVDVEHVSTAGGRLHAWCVVHAFHKSSGKSVSLPLFQAWFFENALVTRVVLQLDRIETRAQVYGEAPRIRRPAPPPALTEEDSHRNARRLSAVLQAFARKDYKPFWDLLDDEALWTCALSRDDFPFGGTFVGKQEIRSFSRLYAACFEVLNYETISMVRSGALIVHTSRVRLKSVASGESAVTDHTGLWFFRDGKVLTYTEHFDTPVLRGLLAGSDAMPSGD